MYRALYRKYRPKDFDSVCGQDHITSVLKYEVANNRTSHAYLFCGSRGTGKTTCAKLLSKAVNCLNPEGGNPCGRCEACLAIDGERTTDVTEMDAASNTGVDYIRDIKEAVMYAPSMLKNKVYIIDEVHMLTQSAFNALLKTLEEPPANVVFILATTEQHKIPATILSRCQKFEFRRITAPVIADRLAYIAKEEGFTLERPAAMQIAKLAQGGMRDAISLLELCAGEGREINTATVREITGSTGREQAEEVAEAVLEKDTDRLFETVERLVASSKEIGVFWQELIGFYRDLLVVKSAKRPENYLDVTEEEMKVLKDTAEKYKQHTLLRHCALLEETYGAMQRPGAVKRLCAEMTFLKMCDEKLDVYPAGLAARVSGLEEKLALLTESGGVIPALADVSASEQAKPIMYKKSVLPETTAAAEASEPSGKAAKPEIKTQRSSAKPVSWWAEAVSRVAESTPSVAPFMKMSQAFENEGGLLIRVRGAMAIELLDTREFRKKLSESAYFCSGKRYAPESLRFTEADMPKEQTNPIDEL